MLDRKLKFIGRNGSMGLIHGKIYDAKVYAESGLMYVQWRGGRCPYQSIKAFRKNWDVVE